MKVIHTALPGVLILEPRVFADARGFMMESYNRRGFREATGRDVDFVQDNHSRSVRNTLRGLHYQIRQAQGKLVRVTAGEIVDVAVDIRRCSPHFGRWVAMRLAADRPQVTWIPEGFAHGFLVLSEHAEVQYKVTDYYAPEHERCIRWNDPALAIDWPLAGEPVVSDKDRRGSPLGGAELFD